MQIDSADWNGQVVCYGCGTKKHPSDGRCLKSEIGAVNTVVLLISRMINTAVFKIKLAESKFQKRQNDSTGKCS